MANPHKSIDDYLEHAKRIETEFYSEKERACSIIEEALIICNNVTSIKRKKSIVRSTKRNK